VSAPGRLQPTDWLVWVYNLAALLAVAASRRTLSGWTWLAAAHVMVLVAVPPVAWNDRRGPGSPGRYVHLWYPVALLVWLYGEAGALRHLWVPHDLDAWVEAWDAALFPGRLYAWLLERGWPLVLDLLHGLYFSYYPLLFVPGLVAQRRRSAPVEARLREYVFVLLLAMLLHYVAGVLFPVSGPLALRRRLLPEGFLFIPLLEGIYAAFDRGGLAFPSTHVAAALIAAYYGGELFPGRRGAYASWAALVALATVACGFHYTVDAVAGALSGALCLLAGREAWRRLGAG
jgi:membrane-associated phospholipid phosphatase